MYKKLSKTEFFKELKILKMVRSKKTNLVITLFSYNTNLKIVYAI